MVTLKINEVRDGIVKFFIVEGKMRHRHTMNQEMFNDYLEQNGYRHVQCDEYEKDTTAQNG